MIVVKGTEEMMRKRGRAGAVLLEFALVIALLVALATGIADAGLAFRIKHVLRIASREGARVASVTPGLQANDPKVLTDVVDEILTTANIDLARVNRSVEAAPATGQPVTVEVTYDYEPLFLGLGVGLTGTVVLRSSSTMRYEVLATS